MNPVPSAGVKILLIPLAHPLEHDFVCGKNSRNPGGNETDEKAILHPCAERQKKIPITSIFMMHSNSYRVCKSQNAAPKEMVFSASWLGIFAALVWLVASQTPALPEKFSPQIKSRISATASQEEHRSILERKLARVIRSLALSPMEVKSLPDTYTAAVQQGAFSNKLENYAGNFLPSDLFATNTPWFEVQPEHLLNHTLMVEGRSVFRAFVKPPAGFTNVLEDHVRNLEEWRRQYQAWGALRRGNHAKPEKMEPPRPTCEVPGGR